MKEREREVDERSTRPQREDVGNECVKKRDNTETGRVGEKNRAICNH